MSFSTSLLKTRCVTIVGEVCLPTRDFLLKQVTGMSWRVQVLAYICWLRLAYELAG